MAKTAKTVRILDIYCHCKILTPGGMICPVCGKFIRNNMGIVSREGLGAKVKVRDK